MEKNYLIEEVFNLVEQIGGIPFLSSMIKSNNKLECAQFMYFILKVNNTGINMHNKIWLPFDAASNFKLLKILYEDVSIDLIPKRGGPDIVLFDESNSTVDLCVQFKATQNIQRLKWEWFIKNYLLYKESCDYIQVALFDKHMEWNSSHINNIIIPSDCDGFFQIEHMTNEKLLYILNNANQIIEYKKILKTLLYNKDIWIKIAKTYYESQKSIL